MGYGGYMGKLLQIDLTAQTVREYPWSDQDRETYLGGKIMSQRLMQELLTGQESAFSEENPVILATGPLTGTGAPGTMRFDIASLSPRDDLPAFANSGGKLGFWLKKAGYDSLILTGRCRKTQWLEIRDGRIRFHDADDLWGTRVSACRELLAASMETAHFGSLCIGPAGEHLVKYASVIADGHSTGRAGLGAVLGWKNLKAIAITGTNAIPLFNAEGAARLARQWHADLLHRGRGEPGSVCTGCPLHCVKHDRDQESILNELGLDSIAAAEAAQWAAAQGVAEAQLYEDIAYRRGLGDVIPARSGKTGSRRSGSHRAIAEAFHLPLDAPETDRFCKNLTDAVSAAGQCMFTLNAVEPRSEGNPLLNIIPMLALVTGMDMDLQRLLEIGARSREHNRSNPK